MKLPFCTNIDDPDTGETILMDIEGEADICLNWDAAGSKCAFVTAVYVNGVNLYRSPLSMFRQMAAFIAKEIEADPRTFEVLLEDEAREGV